MGSRAEVYFMLSSDGTLKVCAGSLREPVLSNRMERMQTASEGARSEYWRTSNAQGTEMRHGNIRRSVMSTVL